MSSFDDFNLGKRLTDAIHFAGFTHPTPIQQACIRPMLAGRNLVGISQTGTGKTAAFAIPLLHTLNYAQGDKVRGLILSPTRELALQTTGQIVKLAAGSSIRTLAIYGGVASEQQLKKVQEGVDVIVATPGRLMELYEQGLSFKALKIFVIDEADRMMDMGFIRAIHSLLEVLPRKKQCCLFSATMNAKVEALYGDFVDFPLLLEVDRPATPAALVVAALYVVPGIESKYNLLRYLMLSRIKGEKVIIFCNSKRSANGVVERVASFIGPSMVLTIHGNKGQNTRLNALESLRDGEIICLVATDVASRGIDVAEVRYVINFEVPVTADDYVHRIGRTGRAGASGEAITLSARHETYYVKKIEKLIKQKLTISLVPKEVELKLPTKAENIAMDREIDAQHKMEDPLFKGAFQEKKKVRR